MTHNSKKMLLNASNLHVGGGIQVAVSVISELSQMDLLPEGLVVWASQEIDENIRGIGCDTSKLPSYSVVDSYGIRFLFSPARFRLEYFDVVFTLFGPLYSFGSGFKRITGFAQPGIIYPEIEDRNGFWFNGKLFRRLKFAVQEKFFRMSDVLVVELEHVRDSILRRRVSRPSTAIHVVYNCLSLIYEHPCRWTRLDFCEFAPGIRLGFVGRNYSHKNTQIFPHVIDILKQKHGITARIYVTFSDEEWADCDDKFRANVINVGPLSAAQCPSFYQKMDGVIFPSLLECFSVTPLEALAMEKPLFASDRSFIRDICFEHAHYFDPLSPASAADAISKFFLGEARNRVDLRVAKNHAFNFSNARNRAKNYLALLLDDSSNTVNHGSKDV